MTPERAARLVLRWVAVYARSLPPAVADRRRAEIAADLHDHLAAARSTGQAGPVSARALLTRALRGVAADVRWRHHQTRLVVTPGVRVLRPLTRSILRVTHGVAVVLTLPLGANLVGAGSWSIADFALAAVVLGVVGTVLELAVRGAGGALLPVPVAALGGAACVAGDADDAPGLIALGLLLVTSAAVQAVRHSRRLARRSS